MKHEQSRVPGHPGEHAVEPHQAGSAPDTTTVDDTASRLAACEAELARVLKDQALVAYGVSHDLRAPLRAIEGFAAMLESGSASALDDRGRDYLARIRAAAARMGGLIDALQALSQASSDALEISDVDASLLADWSLVELRDAEPARQAETTVQPGIHVRADERSSTRVRPALTNAWNSRPPLLPCASTQRRRVMGACA